MKLRPLSLAGPTRASAPVSSVRPAPAVAGCAAAGAATGLLAGVTVDLLGTGLLALVPGSPPPVSEPFLQLLRPLAGGTVPLLVTGALSAGLAGYFMANPSEPRGWLRSARQTGNLLRADYDALARAGPGERLGRAAAFGGRLGAEGGAAAGILSGALIGAELGLRLSGPVTAWLQSLVPPDLLLPASLEGLLPLGVVAGCLLAGQSVGTVVGGALGRAIGTAVGESGAALALRGNATELSADAPNSVASVVGSR